MSIQRKFALFDMFANYTGVYPMSQLRYSIYIVNAYIISNENNKQTLKQKSVHEKWTFEFVTCILAFELIDGIHLQPKRECSQAVAYHRTA